MLRRARGVPQDIQAAQRPPLRARDVTPAPVALPEHISPPLDSRKLFLTGRVSSFGAGNTGELISVSIDSGEEATLESITMFVTNMIDATSIFWSVLVDGTPLPGLNALTVLGRVAASYERIEDLRNKIQGAAVISVNYLNTDGGAYDIGTQLSGWRMNR